MKIDVRFKPWDGRRVTEECVEEWKEQAVQYLLDHPKEMDYSIASGDTMVRAERHCYGIVVYDLFVRRSATLRLETK